MEKRKSKLVFGIVTLTFLLGLLTVFGWRVLCWWLEVLLIVE